jgi:hypothetical protein
MISIKLALTCLVAAGGALFVFNIVWYLLEKKLALLKSVPSAMLEESGAGLFISNFFLQFAFLVALPTVVYSWFYTLVPFYGLRSGVAIAVFLFVMGMVPLAATFILRVKIPLAFALFYLAGYLLRLIVVYGIIAWIYIL